MSKVLKKQNDGRKRITGLFKYLIIITTTGLLVYFLRPLKYSIHSYPIPVSGNYSLSCENLTGTSFFPKKRPKEEVYKTIEASLYKSGEKIGVKINEEKLELATPTSVGMGQVEPLELRIVENSEDEIMTVAYEKPIFSKIIHTFLLSKKTGFAIWTKVTSPNPNIDMLDIPYSQMYYYLCK